MYSEASRRSCGETLIATGKVRLVDATTDVITFTLADGVNVSERPALQAVVDGFDFSDAAQAIRDANSKPERKNLRDAAVQAIADIDTYLAIGSPTAPQVTAAVRKLAQQNKQIIQRLIQID